MKARLRIHKGLRKRENPGIVAVKRGNSCQGSCELNLYPSMRRCSVMGITLITSKRRGSDGKTITIEARGGFVSEFAPPGCNISSCFLWPDSVAALRVVRRPNVRANSR